MAYFKSSQLFTFLLFVYDPFKLRKRCILQEVDGGSKAVSSEVKDKKRTEERKMEDKDNDRGRADWLGLTDTTPVTPTAAAKSNLSASTLALSNPGMKLALFYLHLY